MKRKPLWKELNLPPPPKKPTKTDASPRSPADAGAAQQTVRSNCVKMLLTALTTSSPDEGQQPGGSEPSSTDPGAEHSGIVAAIERELFLHHQSSAGQEYRSAARTLVASLKRNADLRRRVLSGDVRPSQLAAMDARQLATQEQQQEYARLQEQETRRVTLAGRGSGTVATNEYVCSSCGGRTCDYLDSGRRDIGKCETWGSKDGQGSSRLVTCLGCGHRWEVDDV